MVFYFSGTGNRRFITKNRFVRLPFIQASLKYSATGSPSLLRQLSGLRISIRIVPRLPR